MRRCSSRNPSFFLYIKNFNIFFISFTHIFYIITYTYFFNTIIRTRHVLDSAEVPLHPDANTVILIRQLQPGRRLVIEGLYLPGDSSEVLKAALLSSVYCAAAYLRDTNLPGSRKRIAARNEGQSNRIGLADTRVYVHCKKYSARIENRIAI